MRGSLQWGPPQGGPPKGKGPAFPPPPPPPRALARPPPRGAGPPPLPAVALGDRSRTPGRGPLEHRRDRGPPDRRDRAGLVLGQGRAPRAGPVAGGLLPGPLAHPGPGVGEPTP